MLSLMVLMHNWIIFPGGVMMFNQAELHPVIHDTFLFVNLLFIKLHGI